MVEQRSAAKKPVQGWFLYILSCRDSTLYTGITTDLARRLGQHNNGSAARYTRSRTPVRMVYQEPCANRSEALQREYAVKQMTRQEKERLVRRRKKRVSASGGKAR